MSAVECLEHVAVLIDAFLDLFHCFDLGPLPDFVSFDNWGVARGVQNAVGVKKGTSIFWGVWEV